MEITIKEYIKAPVIYNPVREEIQDQDGKLVLELFILGAWSAQKIKDEELFMEDLGSWIAQAINEKLGQETDISQITHKIKSKKEARDNELAEWLVGIWIAVIAIALLISILNLLNLNT